MRSLPDINDEQAMLLRGKRSALREARIEAIKGLRDAYTDLDGADWGDLHSAARVCREHAERLMTLAAMWGEIE